MTYTLIPNIWYTITPETDCDIDTPNGISIHLPAGIQYFHFADCVSIDISGTATVTQNPPLFKPASASALGGGYIESDLNVGHGAAAAVAAVCTLTLGNLATGGTLADSNGQGVELEDPHRHAGGGAVFRDATESCTLSIGEWSKTWEAKPQRNASLILTPLESYDGTETPYKFSTTDTNKTCEFEWDAPAESTVLDLKAAINSEDGFPHWTEGPPHVVASVDDDGKLVLTRNVDGTGGNGCKVTPSDNTPFELMDEVEFTNGQDARTARDVFNDILEAADCPVDVTLDADEQVLGFTAKEYGVNDTISAEGDMFSNWEGMSGGHGDYSVAELVTAIAGEFDDITPTAGEAAGTIVLTAGTAGAAANAITYAATGCFGSGTVKQGSTTRGKNAVAQTDFEIILNGGTPQPLDLTYPEPLKNGHVYTLAVAAATDLSAVRVKEYATCELWLNYTAGAVTWPDGCWWAEGSEPTLEAGKSYAVALRSDGVTLRANVQYEDDTPAQS